MDKRAIGVFDSGLGGLTAVRRLHALMPQENIIYFGDTGRVPYGTRGRDIITKYARQDVAFLRQFDLKSIIIACNTVSAIALDLLSKENDIPIIGTVEPACRRAMTMTQTGRVGVIGTAATSVRVHTRSICIKRTARSTCSRRRVRCSCRWSRTAACTAAMWSSRLW